LKKILLFLVIFFIFAYFRYYSTSYAKSYEIKERGIVISLNAEIQYASLIPEI
jgi:hypothetical protein